MRKLVSIMLVLAMIISSCALTASISFAGDLKTYYVDSASGSDENDGLSEETAWKTLYAHSGFDFRIKLIFWSYLNHPLLLRAIRT